MDPEDQNTPTPGEEGPLSQSPRSPREQAAKAAHRFMRVLSGRKLTFKKTGSRAPSPDPDNSSTVEFVKLKESQIPEFSAAPPSNLQKSKPIPIPPIPLHKGGKSPSVKPIKESDPFNSNYEKTSKGNFPSTYKILTLTPPDGNHTDDALNRVRKLFYSEKELEELWLENPSVFKKTEKLQDLEADTQTDRPSAKKLAARLGYIPFSKFFESKPETYTDYENLLKKCKELISGKNQNQELYIFETDPAIAAFIEAVKTHITISKQTENLLLYACATLHYTKCSQGSPGSPAYPDPELSEITEDELSYYTDTEEEDADYKIRLN